jgi:hypothetical protein
MEPWTHDSMVHVMELTPLHANAGTNKMSAIVIKVVEHLLNYGHSLWMDSF